MQRAGTKAQAAALEKRLEADQKRVDVLGVTPASLRLKEPEVLEDIGANEAEPLFRGEHALAPRTAYQPSAVIARRV